MSDVVIKAEHLSKYYKLGVINNGTFFRDMQTWLALKFGKPDPHSKIGEHKYDGNKEGFWALKDLNFEIHQGDRVGIIGKNGAGKSTLLKVLSRITAPTEGIVKIKGRVASLLEVGTGFHAELTGRENIYLNGAILGMKRREVTRKLDEIIAFSEIEEHIDTPVKRYSSGMYVRLAFAVAAHLDSEILIADEVLAVGDASFQKKALGKMNDLSTGEGRTILFVSHQMNQVKRLCDRGLILEKGRIIRQDNDINNSINYYLGTNDFGDTLKTTSWKNDGSFQNDYFCPQSFFITDKNNHVITGPMDYENEYRIHLEVDIKYIYNLYFSLNVFQDNNPIDTININAKEYLNHKEIIFTIPKRSFTPGEYIFSIGAFIHMEKEIIKPNEYIVIINSTIIGKNSSIIKINP